MTRTSFKTLWPARARQECKRFSDTQQGFETGSGHKASNQDQPSGFTLVELLVVIAIIAMLMTALFPAIQSMRASARRAQCRNQLLQLSMAVQSYEMAQEHYPTGVEDANQRPIQSSPQGHHLGWLTKVLPYLDETNLARRIDPQASVYGPENEAVRSYRLAQLICPTEISDQVAPASSYAANHHHVEAPIDVNNQGVFFLNSEIRVDDIHDGLAQTLFLGEKLIDQDDLGWMSGTRATLRNTGSPINRIRGLPWQSNSANAEDQEADANDQEEEGVDLEATDDLVETPADEDEDEKPVEAEAQAPALSPANPLAVGGFSSSHPSGAHVVFGDGRIQFVSPQINLKVWQALGNRDDGQLLQPEEYRD